jgi:hypothetical protein
MVRPGEATAQTLCSNSMEYDLSYGLWRSPLDAQDWVRGARDANALDCDPSTREAIKRILPGARTGCENKPERHKEGEGIAIWWSKNGSRVAARS